MSATVERSNQTPWRKRMHEDEAAECSKRPRYYFRLESESSRSSEEENESIYSYQGLETDLVRDTTDTDTKSDCSSQDEYEVEIEYDVASASEEENFFSNSSSGAENIMVAAAAAAAFCDSSLEAWITDCEDSDNSSLDGSTFANRGFSTCIQCKSANDNPLYRYCEKCFQQSCRQCKMRKTYKCFPLCNSCYKNRKQTLPPRPKKHRRAKKQAPVEVPKVKLDALRSCLSGLSQDSGLGSSQECPSLGLDKITIPEHLSPSTSKSIENVKLPETPNDSDKSGDSGIETVSTEKKGSESKDSGVENRRKRQCSESSLSDVEVKRSRRKSPLRSSDEGFETRIKLSVDRARKEPNNDKEELCIICNVAIKDSIFLHTNIGHQCCCYKCAKRTLQTIKRCPICNLSVNKVIKIYKS